LELPDSASLVLSAALTAGPFDALFADPVFVELAFGALRTSTHIKPTSATTSIGRPQIPTADREPSRPPRRFDARRFDGCVVRRIMSSSPFVGLIYVGLLLFLLWACWHEHRNLQHPSVGIVSFV